MPGAADRLRRQAAQGTSFGMVTVYAEDDEAYGIWKT